MLFSLLFTLVAAISTVFAEDLGQGSKAARACRDELEGVVYTPQNCALSYLKRITQVLEAQSPLLWTDQAQAVIQNFASTYNVLVAVISPFGELYYYPGALVTNAPPVAASVDRAWALGEGFSSYEGINLNGTPFYAYNTNVWNENGEMWTLSVAMNKADAPAYC